MPTNKNDSLQPFLAMEIFAKATKLEQAGHKICHLELGEPENSAAPNVIKAIKNALAYPQKYTHAKGKIELRNALVKHYKSQYNVEVKSENIIVTLGSSSAFTLAFLAAFEIGDKIAVTRPGYPAYPNIIDVLGFKSLEIELNAENKWRLSASDIEKAYKKQSFRGLLFASPANPTGASINRAEFEKIVKTCERLGVRLISDEIYHGLDYEQKSITALEFDNNVIIANSFSKYYCMTGMRIGWLIMPSSLIRKAEMLQQNMFISAPSLSQVAAIAALEEDEYSLANKQQYKENRMLLTNGLKALGFDEVNLADGAFYVYVNVSKFTTDSLDFCQQMLEKSGVAATPGADFDRVNGHKYVRFSYAGSHLEIELALEKIKDFLSLSPAH